MTTNQTAPVTDEELDQMIWKLERDGMTPKQLSLMREVREVRRAKGEPVAYADPQAFINFKAGGARREWMWRNPGEDLMPLYTAPPAPVVPTNVADAIERLKQRLADCHRFNYCAEAVREVEDASRIVMLQAGNSRGIPDEQSFWDWLRDKMPTTYRWSRELEDTPENSALITKGKASALDMLSAWKGCSATMLNHSGDTADMVENVSNRDELPPNSFTNEDLAGMAHGDNPQANAYRELLSRRLNSPETPDGWIPVSERMPEESGRYWCYVEEQNDLGKSHYQWNCSWNGERWWVESENGGKVTHWMELPAPPKEVG